MSAESPNHFDAVWDLIAFVLHATVKYGSEHPDAGTQQLKVETIRAFDERKRAVAASGEETPVQAFSSTFELMAMLILGLQFGSGREAHLDAVRDAQKVIQGAQGWEEIAADFRTSAQRYAASQERDESDQTAWRDLWAARIRWREMARPDTDR
jgi:hypothetical protein